MKVTIKLPGILKEAIGTGKIKVDAQTLQRALDEACRIEPALKFHLFDDNGMFREHILCFHNSSNTRNLTSLNVSLADGDEITIVQAISGG